MDSDSITNRTPEPAGGFYDLSTLKPDASPTTPIKQRVCCEGGGVVDMERDAVSEIQPRKGSLYTLSRKMQNLPKILSWLV